MESFLLPQIKAHHHYTLPPFASIIPIPKSKRPSSSSSTVLFTQTPRVALAPQSFKLSENGRFCNSLVVECGKGSGGQLVESHQPEDLQEEEEEEWAGIEEEWKWGNCQGAKGIVELMECLEREAIMGEDQGIHPSDYNRRAQIFDKSSAVFQALKDNQP